MPETLRDRRIRYARTLIATSPGALLDEAGDLTGLDVLVLGHQVGETMCELTMTECRSVEARAPGCRVDRRAADVVVVPNLTETSARGVVEQATRALDRGGRMVVRLPREASRLAYDVRVMLAVAGFDAIREIRSTEARVVSASRAASV